MNLYDLVEIYSTMKEVMKDAVGNERKFTIHKLKEGADIEILQAQEDYALMRESLPAHMGGGKKDFIAFYGGSVGYALEE